MYIVLERREVKDYGKQYGQKKAQQVIDDINQKLIISRNYNNPENNLSNENNVNNKVKGDRNDSGCCLITTAFGRDIKSRFKSVICFVISIVFFVAVFSIVGYFCIDAMNKVHKMLSIWFI